MSVKFGALLAAGMLTSTSALAASDPSRSIQDAEMPIAGSAQPPSGWTELCQRSPIDCDNDASSIQTAVWSIQASSRRVDVETSELRPQTQARGSAVIYDASPLWRAKIGSGAESWSRPFAIMNTTTARPLTSYRVLGGSSRGGLGNLGLQPVDFRSTVWRLDSGTAFKVYRGPTRDAVLASAPPIAPEYHEPARTVATPPAPVADVAADRPPRSNPLLNSPGSSGVSMREVARINRLINRSIRSVPDSTLYRSVDYWVVPTGGDAKGDCEDFVLAKRRALIAAGVSPDALAISVVRTRRQEIHAVLLISMPDGEYVLDNLSPWVLPWREAPYQWMQRQAHGHPGQWVQAGLATAPVGDGGLLATGRVQAGQTNLGGAITLTRVSTLHP